MFSNKRLLYIVIFSMILLVLVFISLHYMNSTNNIVLWVPTALKSCAEDKIPPLMEWKNEDEIRSVRISVDIDNDTIFDQLEAQHGDGTGMAEIAVTLTLTSSKAKIQVNRYISFSYFVSITRIPEQLLDEKNRCALNHIEAALLFNVSNNIDPSLEWLIKKQKYVQWSEKWMEMDTTDDLFPVKDEIKWYDGQAEFPNSYTLRVKGNNGTYWVSYLGHNHIRYKKPRKFTLLAQHKNYLLIATAHGVILTNKKRAKYAWIYVYTGGNKLRWQSIGRARIDNNIAIIDVRGLTLQEDEKPEVRINLITGKFIPLSYN